MRSKIFQFPFSSTPGILQIQTLRPSPSRAIKVPITAAVNLQHHRKSALTKPRKENTHPLFSSTGESRPCPRHLKVSDVLLCGIVRPLEIACRWLQPFIVVFVASAYTPPIALDPAQKLIAFEHHANARWIEPYFTNMNPPCFTVRESKIQGKEITQDQRRSLLLVWLARSLVCNLSASLTFVK